MANETCWKASEDKHTKKKKNQNPENHSRDLKSWKSGILKPKVNVL